MNSRRRSSWGVERQPASGHRIPRRSQGADQRSYIQDKAPITPGAAQAAQSLPGRAYPTHPFATAHLVPSGETPAVHSCRLRPAATSAPHVPTTRYRLAADPAHPVSDDKHQGSRLHVTHTTPADVDRSAHRKRPYLSDQTPFGVPAGRRARAFSVVRRAVDPTLAPGDRMLSLGSSFASHLFC